MADVLTQQEPQTTPPAISQTPLTGHDRVVQILFDEDEISWQAMLYELVAEEHMDPWDVDISNLAVKFLEMVKKLKEMDFRIGGKVVLASALLLRLKSQRLVDGDLNALQRLMDNREDGLGDIFDTPDDMLLPPSGEHPAMYARTPQPRKRKVSLYDLMNALEKALEVQGRRKRFMISPLRTETTVPEKTFDLTKSMDTLFERIDLHFHDPESKKHRLLFDQLTPSDSRQDKVLTFIPLLHLDTARKVDLLQEKHFGEIEVTLAQLDPNFIAGIHEKDAVKQGSATIKAEAAKTI